MPLAVVFPYFFVLARLARFVCMEAAAFSVPDGESMCEARA